MVRRLRRGPVRHGAARRGMAGSGGHGVARLGAAWQCMARRGMFGQGPAVGERLVTAGRRVAWRSWLGLAVSGVSCYGMAVKAREGPVGNGMAGFGGPVAYQQETASLRRCRFRE